MSNILPTAGASRVKIGRARERKNTICLTFTPICNFLDLVALSGLELLHLIINFQRCDRSN